MNYFYKFRYKLGLFAISFFLVLFLTYPYSPILYEFYLFNTAYSYFIYTLVSILLIFFIAILAISYIVTANKTPIRDILFLTFILSLVNILSKEEYINLVNNYIFIISFMLLVAWIVHIFNFIGIIDRLNWQLKDVFISSTNPFVERYGREDFEWSLLLNYAVLAFNPDVKYQRATLIFLEPSNLAQITFPLLFIVLLNKKNSLQIHITFYFVNLIFCGIVWMGLSNDFIE